MGAVKNANHDELEHRRAVEDGMVPGLYEAASAIIERMSSTFKARNGRDVGIQGDDGEKCWIVHSDDIEALRLAIAMVRGEA